MPNGVPAVFQMAYTYLYSWIERIAQVANKSLNAIIAQNNFISIHFICIYVQKLIAKMEYSNSETG